MQRERQRLRGLCADMGAPSTISPPLHPALSPVHRACMLLACYSPGDTFFRGTSPVAIAG